VVLVQAQRGTDGIFTRDVRPDALAAALRSASRLPMGFQVVLGAGGLLGLLVVCTLVAIVLPLARPRT
jgi:hypothetical protein